MPQPEGVQELVNSFPKQWDFIQLASDQLDISLNTTKEKFRQYTIKEVHTFIEEVNVFQDKFDKDGPGNPKTPMDQGLSMVLQYKHELKELCNRRDELHLAEKLFDIPLTSYPQLNNITNTLSSLQQIYQLFDEQQHTMSHWSQMLWSEVNV